MTDTMTKATIKKENTYLGLAYGFRGLVHYHHGRKHGILQIDMVRKELGVLHLHLKSSQRRLSSAGSQKEVQIPH